MNQNSIGKSKGTRILSIDIIRGFSILGIFIVNMMYFHTPLLYLDPLSFFQGSDRVTYIMIDIFAQGSFYPLFSLLFGYSFVLFRRKILNKSLNFKTMAVRRLFFLLLIGIVHAFFVWHGDILILYATIGFLLIFLLALPGKTLFLCGMLLYGIPALFLHILFFIVQLSAPNGNPGFINHSMAEKSMQIYQYGDFLAITKQRIIDWLTTNNLETIPFLVVTILPLFLIGAGLAKLGWLEKKQRSLPFIIVFSLCIGLLLKSMPYFFSENILAQYTQESIGGLCLAIFYGALLIRLSEFEMAQRWLQPFAAIGRISMSNYLFQSIVSTLIFYQYGLGLYGHLSLLFATLLAFAIFCVQAVLSLIWLKRFSHGPLESIWRAFIYLK
jgi:uncharacterized protein